MISLVLRASDVSIIPYPNPDYIVLEIDLEDIYDLVKLSKYPLADLCLEIMEYTEFDEQDKNSVKALLDIDGEIEKLEDRIDALEMEIDKQKDTISEKDEEIKGLQSQIDNPDDYL
jgi:peptidoglycan hydrolase CwlO-like protein